MERKRFTNAVLGRRGGTTVVTTRVPNEIVEVMTASIGKPDLPNLGAVAQDAFGLWAILEERDAEKE